MVNSNAVPENTLSPAFVERLEATLLKSAKKGASDEVLSFQLAELCADLKPEQLPAFRAELMTNIWPKLARMPVMEQILEGFTWTCRTDAFHPDYWDRPADYQSVVQMKLLGGILDVGSDAQECFRFFLKEYEETIFGKSGQADFSAPVQNPALRKALVELFRGHVFALADKGEREAIHLFTWVRGGVIVRSGREQDDVDRALYQAATSKLDLKRMAGLLSAGLLITSYDPSASLKSIRCAEELCLRFLGRILPEVDGWPNPKKTPFGERHTGLPMLDSWRMNTEKAVTGIPEIWLEVSTALSDKIVDEIRAIRDEICAQADKGKFIGSRKTEIDVTIIVPIDGRPQEIKL